MRKGASCTYGLLLNLRALIARKCEKAVPGIRAAAGKRQRAAAPSFLPGVQMLRNLGVREATRRGSQSHA